MQFEVVKKTVAVNLRVTERELRILTSGVGCLSMQDANRSKATKEHNIDLAKDLTPLFSALNDALESVERD